MAPLAPALLLSLALAACGGNSSSNSPGVGADGSAQGRCVSIINGYRQQVGVSPLLSRWTSAEACADSQCRSDSQTGQPHGASGSCGEHAQNECPGWGSLDQILEGCLAAMFAEGPGQPYSQHGHYINMTNPGYTEVACGFYQTPDGRWWSVQDFR